MSLPPYSSHVPTPIGSFRNKTVLPSSGLRHDLPYMKADIWVNGEIERTFGHDPATYPNQDQLQHYPTIQFSPEVIPEIEAMDNHQNIHVMPRQHATQTSRPGFQTPTTPLRHNNFLVVNTAESNVAGIESAIRDTLPIQAAAQNVNADPLTKAATVRPGFQNPPIHFPHNDGAQAVSVKDSNEVGIVHAIANGIEVKPGYQEIGGTVEHVVPADPKSPQAPLIPADDNMKYNRYVADGSIAYADDIEAQADAAVEKLLGSSFTYDSALEYEATRLLEAKLLADALKAGTTPVTPVVDPVVGDPVVVVTGTPALKIVENPAIDNSPVPTPDAGTAGAFNYECALDPDSY